MMLELVFSSTNCSSNFEEKFVQILLCWSLQGWGEFLTLTLGLMMLELVFSSTNCSSIFEEEFVHILLCWSLQGWGCQIAEEHKNAASIACSSRLDHQPPLFIISDSRSCKITLRWKSTFFGPSATASFTHRKSLFRLGYSPLLHQANAQIALLLFSGPSKRALSYKLPLLLCNYSALWMPTPSFPATIFKISTFLAN